MNSQTGFPAGKKGRTSVLPWGSLGVLSSSSQEKSTIFFTLPSKTHQSYFFPLDLAVKQGCVRNRISLGLEFMIDRVFGMELVWCQGRQYWSSPAKRQHQNPGAGDRRNTNQGLLTEMTESGHVFLACEKEVCVPLGNRVYMKQAEKLKKIACKCSVLLQCRVLRFRKVVHLWGTQVY